MVGFEVRVEVRRGRCGAAHRAGTAEAAQAGLVGRARRPPAATVLAVPVRVRTGRRGAAAGDLVLAAKRPPRNSPMLAPTHRHDNFLGTSDSLSGKVLSAHGDSRSRDRLEAFRPRAPAESGAPLAACRAGWRCRRSLVDRDRHRVTERESRCPGVRSDGSDRRADELHPLRDSVSRAHGPQGGGPCSVTVERRSRPGHQDCQTLEIAERLVSGSYNTMETSDRSSASRSEPSRRAALFNRHPRPALTSGRNPSSPCRRVRCRKVTSDTVSILEDTMEAAGGCSFRRLTSRWSPSPNGSTNLLTI